MTVEVGCGGGANDDIDVLCDLCLDESVWDAIKSAVNNKFQISDKLSNVGWL